MISLKNIRFATLAAFISITIEILFFYINIKSIHTAYLFYPLIALNIISYITVLVYLQHILVFLKEKSSVITAFKVYIGFTIIFFTFNIICSLMLKSYDYYKPAQAIHFIVLLYLFIQLVGIKAPVIKSEYTFWGIASLILIIMQTTLPLLSELFGSGYNLFIYLNLLEIIPAIAAIIIFNKSPEYLKYNPEVAEKSSLSPFDSDDV